MKTKPSLLLLAAGAAYCVYDPSPASAAITGAVTYQDIYLTSAPAFPPGQPPILHNDVTYHVNNSGFTSTNVDMTDDMLAKPTAPYYTFQSWWNLSDSYVQPAPSYVESVFHMTGTGYPGWSYKSTCTLTASNSTAPNGSQTLEVDEVELDL